MASKWLDQRDIPDAKFGKTKLPGCECDYRFTCRVCLERATARNLHPPDARKTKEEV